jgi:CubicO group peptidase (beta-lactamase class C family)
MADIVAGLPEITPLGELWSYCNSGFYLAGRVIEVLTGTTYEAAARELVLDPLGMTESYFFPEDVMTSSFAVGHDVDGDLVTIARPWNLARSAHAAGGITASIRDMLRYARFWLGDGTGPAGDRVLSRESMRTMTTPAVPASTGRWTGITWFVEDAAGGRIIQHTGGTNGQVSAFLVVPEKQFAVTVLTNASKTAVTRDISTWALDRYADVRRAEPEPMPVSAEALREYAGRYEAAASILDLEPDGESLCVRLTPRGGFPFPDSPPEPAPPPFHVEILEGEQLRGMEEEWRAPLGEFLRDKAGVITWLRFGSRMHRKT